LIHAEKKQGIIRNPEMRKRLKKKYLPEKDGTSDGATAGTTHRIKIKDIASHCLVSQTTVRRWIETGQLRAFKLPSGHFRINQVDYRRFLEENGIWNVKSASGSKF
jgi:excisionase family DNA binding protein